MRANVVATMLALGCPTTNVPDPDPPRATDDGATTPPPTASCGDATTTFADATPLPAESTLVALVRRDADDLAPALARLAQHVEGGGSGLSVPTGFALGQWKWEVPLVLSVLDGLRVHTMTLAAVQANRLRVWVVPLGCGFDDLLTMLATDFAIKDTGGAAIATPNDRTRFAHDIIVRPDAIVLCPPGTARRVLAAWERTPPPNAPPTLRDLAFGLEAATVRVAVRETGLLGQDAPDSHTTDHLLRIDGERVDARLAP